MTEKAKLMTDAEIDGIAAGTMQDCHLREFLSLCQQARLANAQAERLERLEGIGKLDGFYVNNSPIGVTPVTDLTEHEVHDYCNKLIKQGYTFEAVSQMRTAAIVGRRFLAALSPSTTKGEG